MCPPLEDVVHEHDVGLVLVEQVDLVQVVRGGPPGHTRGHQVSVLVQVGEGRGGIPVLLQWRAQRRNGLVRVQRVKEEAATLGQHIWFSGSGMVS